MNTSGPRQCRAFIALLFLLFACATSAPDPKVWETQSPRRANLQRAAALPWTDGGRCVVHEAAQPWPVMAERCFSALDQERVRFQDATGRCTVASAVAAVGLGLCVLAAPELVVGAVIVIGVVVVAAAIQHELDVYALSGSYPENAADPRPGTTAETQELLAEKTPKVQESPEEKNRPPPVPPGVPGPERRPECTPVRVPPKGGNTLHNLCADRIPFNAFRGANALVNGKAFDALQVATRTLWEVKTDDFDKHSHRSREFFIDMQVPEIERERKLAKECGYDFVVGVRSAAHKEALIERNFTLKIVVMDWC